ncbi:hypothetical protein D9757_001060 [Collybiopsis confluens]|uniref:S-adenosyl-L-methionine-dependent methyltransferase n=1 Tax=Collybiopsis confluens TaxID=2823264 RepID=A0A8H5MGE2_9AGAR|nr:hypothetical protein D9757_001060 [Collybiopsis confluens]
MVEVLQRRYYASEQYLLPADTTETARSVHHRVIVAAFANRLLLAPVELKTGNYVLESAAGTGVWALEFLEENKKKNVILNMDCVDISDKQFPREYPSNLHFSLHSITDLPTEWNSRFSYAHQRLLVAALNDELWRKAISEFFRVLAPGGWLELVEIEIKNAHWDVGPSSGKLTSLLPKLYGQKGCICDLGNYLPPLLRETGFVDVQCVARDSPMDPTGESGFVGWQWGDFWKGLTRAVMEAGGCGVVNSAEEYEKLVDESAMEWDDDPGKAYSTYYAILGRKPEPSS